jgi:hypothetical protein
MSDKPQEHKPGLGSVIMSTLSAFIGIQSSKNRERDFAKGNFKAYVISGLIFTVVFITSIVMLVKFLIANAGS